MWHSDPEDRTISSVKSGHLKSVIWGQPTSVLTKCMRVSSRYWSSSVKRSKRIGFRLAQEIER